MGRTAHPNQFARKLYEEPGWPIDEDGGVSSQQAVWNF